MIIIEIAVMMMMFMIIMIFMMIIDYFGDYCENKTSVPINITWSLSLRSSVIIVIISILFISGLPYFVFCIFVLTTNNHKKYKSVELGDQLIVEMPI